MAYDYMAVIQAGGKGTRMEVLTGNKIPKPMLRLNGRPLLEWQIENIKKYDIYQFVFIIGHLGEQIREYFGDGSRFGIHIRYIEEKEPLGSAGSLSCLKPMLSGSAFFLIFGDVMFDLDLRRMIRFHERHGGAATLLVHPNAHPFDSDLVVMDQCGCVTGMLSKKGKREGWYENCVNAGIYILSDVIPKRMQRNERRDLECDVLLPLIRRGEVYGYRTTEYVKDAGTPERFLQVEREQSTGVWRRKNLDKKQACVFIDRDGTINKYKGLIYSEEQFELEEGAATAIRWLNESGLLAIVVTNQSVVARGLCGMEDVERIHRKMQVLLGKQGAYLDDIAFCPHHPDKGYPEENPAYKTVCNCRKPATGMIMRMVKKYNIDLSRSYMVGDSTIDMETGRNAGLRTILVLTGQAGEDGKYATFPDQMAANLEEAVSKIFEMEKDERRVV